MINLLSSGQLLSSRVHRLASGRRMRERLKNGEKRRLAVRQTAGNPKESTRSRSPRQSRRSMDSRSRDPRVPLLLLRAWSCAIWTANLHNLLSGQDFGHASAVYSGPYEIPSARVDLFHGRRVRGEFDLTIPDAGQFHRRVYGHVSNLDVYGRNPHRLLHCGRLHGRHAAPDIVFRGTEPELCHGHDDVGLYQRHISGHGHGFGPDRHGCDEQPDQRRHLSSDQCHLVELHADRQQYDW